MSNRENVNIVSSCPEGSLGEQQEARFAFSPKDVRVWAKRKIEAVCSTTTPGLSGLSHQRERALRDRRSAMKSMDIVRRRSSLQVIKDSSLETCVCVETTPRHFVFK